MDGVIFRVSVPMTMMDQGDRNGAIHQEHGLLTG